MREELEDREPSEAKNETSGMSRTPSVEGMPGTPDCQLGLGHPSATSVREPLVLPVVVVLASQLEASLPSLTTQLLAPPPPPTVSPNTASLGGGARGLKE